MERFKEKRKIAKTQSLDENGEVKKKKKKKTQTLDEDGEVKRTNSGNLKPG